MAFKIEKGIPIPKKVGRKKWELGEFAIMLKKMEVDDSIFSVKKKSTLYAAAGIHLGKGKFIIRPEKTGFRLWRTK